MKRIIILSGGFGVGKSYQSFQFEEPIICFDMENKNEDMRQKYFTEKLIGRIDMLKFDDSFNEDYYSTYLFLKTEVDKIIELGRRVRDKKQNDIGFNTLIIDGISFVRNKCMLAKWMKDHKGRKNPNQFEWREINKNTQDLLFPLINMSVSGIIHNLVFTSELKEKYELVDVLDEETNKIIKTSVSVGKVPAYNDFIGYKMITLIDLALDKKVRKAYCSKSLNGIWEKDITNKSLYDVMLEMGL